MNVTQKIVRIFSLLTDKVGRIELGFKMRNQFWLVYYFSALFYRLFIIKKVKIIVVVGSLGKTTTTTAIKYILNLPVSEKFESNAFSAVALKILTTRKNTEYLVIEIGIGRKGDMEKYARMIRPDIVVLTSIASEHITNLGSIDEIRNEKSKIFNSGKLPELIISNGDDENIVKMATLVITRKITYGINPGNDYQCVENRLNWPDGCNVMVRSKEMDKSYKVSLWGEKMIYCFLAAVALAHELNLPADIIKERATNIQPVSGRMQPIKLKNGAIIIRDDFKSSEETNLAALNFLGRLSAKRKFVIMGSSSYVLSYQRQFYKHLGFLIGTIADMAFFVTSKDFEQALSSSAKQAGLDPSCVIKTNDDWGKIPEILRDDLSEGDIILIKGEREQRLERLSLSLEGVKVNCKIKSCSLKYIYCKDCSRLV